MLVMGTKAETLQKLYGQLSRAKVLSSFFFTVKEWKQNSLAIWERVNSIYSDRVLIVRSSALNEDLATGSQAGKYESVGNVAGYDGFIFAVNTVISSFDDGDENNQILVQPMLQNVESCGVAFTMDPNTMGNYYVINYDKTGSTSSVTGGTVEDDTCWYVFRGQRIAGNGFINTLLEALEELEKLFGKNNLDVEFAVEDDALYILQVRELCLNGTPVDFSRQKMELEHIAARIEREKSTKPYLCGKTVIYGVMPDWNPAEMIGIRPKPLALSLYREIITDNIWAYQRDNYGYRNLRSFPLMVEFCGLPYIDVRVSFNSFIPAELEEGISEKLVNYYLDRLAEDPSKHDKVEFEIVFSCYTLDLPERIQILKRYNFTDEEIQKIVDSLRNITNRITDHKNGLWRKDLKKISILEKRQEELLSSDMGDIEKIYWLLEDCKRYGTLPFAGLARAAFIAVQMLLSLVNCSVISEKDYELFMAGIQTVSSGMNMDFEEMSKEAFLKKYGHLRPGTYDITSPRYDEAPDLYFDWQKKSTAREETNGVFRLSIEQMQKLKDALTENGLNNDILELMDFIKEVIEGREYGKFVFTKSLSRVLQLIGEVGEKNGHSKEECSFVNIQAIRELYISTRDVKTSLLRSVAQGKEEYEMARAIILPPLILKPDDVMGFCYPDTEPNYVTQGSVRGEVLIADSHLAEKNLEGKILMIPSADPGYDWIFTQGIRGFVTKYGGVNSHMAIRAGELGVPAVIGIGEKKFERYTHAALLEINALEKKIRVLKEK